MANVMGAPAAFAASTRGFNAAGSAPTLPGGNSADETDTNSSSVLRPPLASSVKQTTAADLKFDESEAVKTGGKLQTLNYTSAGRDGLMAEFKLKSKSVSAEQQAMNLKLGAAVVTAKLSRVAATGEVFVNITLNEFEKIQTYKIKAVVDGDKMKLVSAVATGDLEFQGGFLKCTDLDGGCENAYAKIKMSGAYARIIFRNSYADHNFGIYTNEQAAKNLNFESLLRRASHSFQTTYEQQRSYRTMRSELLLQSATRQYHRHHVHNVQESAIHRWSRAH